MASPYKRRRERRPDNSEAIRRRFQTGIGMNVALYNPVTGLTPPSNAMGQAAFQVGAAIPPTNAALYGARAVEREANPNGNKRPGALSRRLGIPEDEKVPKTLLRAIVNARTGETVTNPTKTGKRRIKVDTRIQRQASLALSLKRMN